MKIGNNSYLQQRVLQKCKSRLTCSPLHISTKISALQKTAEMKTLTSSQFSSFYSGEVIKSPSRVLRAIRFPTSTEYSKSLLLLSHSSQTVCPLGIIPGPVATYADVIRWCAVAPFVKKVFKQKALNLNILLHLSVLHVLMRQ